MHKIHLQVQSRRELLFFSPSLSLNNLAFTERVNRTYTQHEALDVFRGTYD